MEFKNTTAEGSRAAGGPGPRGTSQDFDTGFERKVRAIVSGCSDQERQVLLIHYNQEIEVFLQAPQMEDTLPESNEHILRVLKIVKIVTEEIDRHQIRKRKFEEDVSVQNKKFKISDHRNVEVLKLLGRGSFGSVYLVKDTTTEVQCARKSIRMTGLKSQVKEISIHRRLDHMNIVSFFGEQRDTKFVYIYLEYVSGGTLEDRIEPRGIKENKVQFYFNQLITGVKYLHSQKVAHRDLKPENLLLSTNEDLKIGDFGLAVEFRKDRHLWEVCGTSGYIAPEVFTGRYRGEPADVWSYGIILFRLLTGQKPWEDAQTEDFNFAIWSSSPSKMRLRKSVTLGVMIEITKDDVSIRQSDFLSVLNEQTGKTEVRDLENLVFGHKKVAWLQISVHDTSRVDVCHAIQQLLEVQFDLIFAQVSPFGEEMEFKKSTTEGSRAAGGPGPRGTSKDFDTGFETKVRAIVSGCSDQERQVLLIHYNEEIEVFLQAAQMEDTLQESNEHILRVLKIVKIVTEEIDRHKIRKRKIEEDISTKNKKLKISDHRNVEVLKLLGRGSFGSVYLVKDTTTEVQCARKSIRMTGLKSQVKEISIHRRLDHKNIVSFFGEQRDTKFVYIYLEYVSGGTLEDRIEPRGMEENKVQFYFNQLITGVKYLHSQQVAHRDLKPENLLLSTNEDLKIGDFGLAVEFRKDRHLWEVCGTSGYIAPEVFTGRYRGEPTDVWSCGIILFRLLTGQKPWKDAQTNDFNFAIWSSAPSKMRLRSPWRSLSKNAFGLVKEMLARKRKYRATLSDIEQNDWFQG
ncbi:uncharacterized protein LOC143022471 [Oratosquilla oratoria]|uniref:uncharacterized protein LOC143022471 n=1 Tax=Oratosquilla oratoria TaxID=337810 RepID=UPI003F7775ED